MRIRWGVNPIGWINDDLPALGAGTRLDTILSDASAIGFDGIERGHLFPSDPECLAALLDGYGLALAGAWYGSALLTRDADAEIKAMAPHLAMLERLGSRVCILAETSNAVHTDRAAPLARRPTLDGAWPTFAQRLDRVAAHVAGRGMRLAYHHHLGTVIENASDLDRLLASTGEHVGLVLDTGHAWCGGIDVVAVARAHPRRIVHVHAKDVRAACVAAMREARGSFLDGVIAGIFTTPGDGDIDFAPLARALRDINYQGWIVVEAEQDPGQADPRIYAQLGLDTLRRIIAQGAP